MITRRRFMTSTAATASNSLVEQAPVDAQPQRPLKAEPSVRTLRWKPTDDGRLILFRDCRIASMRSIPCGSQHHVSNWPW